MKLTWEEDYEHRTVIFRKKRGKITIQDLIDTMQDRDFLWIHEGKLFIWDFRPHSERYDDFEMDEPEGDSVGLRYVEDEEPCPICGTKRYWQYCPECGHKLELTEEEKTT